MAICVSHHPLSMAVSMIPITSYVTFELLLNAAIVADESCGYMLEPAHTFKVYTKYYLIILVHMSYLVYSIIIMILYYKKVEQA